MSLLFDRKKKVIVYCRHSREDAQENSIPIQLERLGKYASENNMEIIHVEKDEGISGLTADRPGFQALFNNWVKHPEQTKLFEGVLYFDVSREGRFQDHDEFAEYSRLCKKYGKFVWYVELGALPEKREPMHEMVITMKRLAAADYSAKLSDRVWHGSVKISSQGYSVGGSPCYGMERILLNEQREFICVLKHGEQKQISNQRVSFRPRNDETTETVREIFRLFVERGHMPKSITTELNRRQIPSPNGRTWRSSSILRILRNEVYIGTRVYNKTWQQLGSKERRTNPRDEWVIKPKAFPESVQPSLFFDAQKRLRFILPTERYKGAKLIRSVQKELITEILELIHETNITEQLQKSDQQVFPIIFSIRESDSQWHFLLPEHLRVFETVIGIGLIPDHRVAMERLFAIPTLDFGSYNVLTIPMNSEQEQSYSIDKEQAQKKLLSLLVKVPAPLFEEPAPVALAAQSTSQ